MRTSILASLTAIGTATGLQFFKNDITSYASTEQEVKETKLSENQNVKPKLVQLQVIFRHGARTPVFVGDSLENISFHLCKGLNRPPGVSFDSPPLLKDVNFAQLHVTSKDNKSPRPFSTVDKFQASIGLAGGECRLGQLTEVGARQSHQLGQDLRNRYKDLIDINISKLEVRSTNVGRCMATLSAMLGSFLDFNSLAKRELSNMIVPVKTVASKFEYMTPNMSNCEVLRTYFHEGRIKLNEKFKETEENKENIELKLKNELKKLLPEDIYKDLKVNENNFIRVHDWLKIIETHKTEMNENEVKKSSFSKILNNENLYNLLKKQASIEISTLIGVNMNKNGIILPLNNETKRKVKFSIGFLLKELNENLNNVNENKIYLYSGHDTTIIPLLISLGIYNNNWPGFCSNLVIELWDLSTNNDEVDSESLSDPITETEIETESNNIEQYQIHIVYNGNIMKKLSLSEFRKSLNGLIPKSNEEWKNECNSLTTEQEKLKEIAGGSSF